MNTIGGSGAEGVTSSILEAPKKRGRKPKTATPNVSAIVQSAKLQKKRVLLSATFSKEGRKPRESKLPTPGHPIWKALPVSPPLIDPSMDNVASNSNVCPRPRQWCSSKEELLTILPELAAPKLMMNCPVPVILIEETDGMSLSESELSNENRTVVNLCMDRDFTCVISDLCSSSELSQSTISATHPALQLQTLAEKPEVLSTSQSASTTHSVIASFQPRTSVEKPEAPSTSTSKPGRELGSAITVLAPQTSIARISIEDSKDYRFDLVTVMNSHCEPFSSLDVTGRYHRTSVSAAGNGSLTPTTDIPNSNAQHEVSIKYDNGEQSLAATLTLATARNAAEPTSSKHVGGSPSLKTPATTPEKLDSRAMVLEVSSPRPNKQKDLKIKLSLGSEDDNRRSSPRAIRERRFTDGDFERRPVTRSQEKAKQETLQKSNGTHPSTPNNLPTCKSLRIGNLPPLPAPPAKPKTKTDTPHSTKKPVRDLELSGPSTPLTPEDDLPVRNWENMYNPGASVKKYDVQVADAPGGVLKSLKFTKKKKAQDSRDPVGVNSVISDPSFQPGRSLEAGEIPEAMHVVPSPSASTSSQAVGGPSLKQPPTGPQWSLLQVLAAEELFSRTNLQRPRSVPAAPSRKRDINTTPSSSSLSTRCSLSPFLSSTPISSPPSDNAATSSKLNVRSNITDEQSPASNTISFSPGIKAPNAISALILDPSLSPTPSRPRCKRKLAETEERLVPLDTKRSCPSELVDSSITDEKLPALNSINILGPSSSIESPSGSVDSSVLLAPLQTKHGHKRQVIEMSSISLGLPLDDSPASLGLPPDDSPASSVLPPEAANPSHPAEPFDGRVPIQPPPEVQNLINAYVRNTPVLAITSRGVVLAFCGGSIGNLSPEFQYMYMGFFKVLFVKEERIFRPSSGAAVGILVSSDCSFGRVRWRFGLEWISAGEQNLHIPAHLKLDRPWWRDITDWQKSPSGDVIMQCPDSGINLASNFDSRSVSPSTGIPNNLDAESALRFRDQRQADPSYPSRDKPLGPCCPSIVWLALLASNISVSSTKGDIGCARGWYCNSCGKLNRQRFFLRRKCDSSFCKDTLPTDCSVRPLDSMRSIGQQIPLVFPFDIMPKYMDPAISEWDDGMRTLNYPVWNDNIVERMLDDADEQIQSVDHSSPQSGPGDMSVHFQSQAVKQEASENSNLLMEVSSMVPTREAHILQLARASGIPRLAQDIEDIAKKRRVVAKHIFTCNYSKLQREQTELLGSIQESVVLQRMAMDSTPYFSYVAGTVPKNTFASDFINPDVQPIPWKDVPPCIEQARDFMEHLGKAYGDMTPDEPPSLINQLVVLGWTVTGRKKGGHCLRAKGKSIIIMTLGHELGIRITPKSGFPINALRMKKTSTVKAETPQSTASKNAMEARAMDVDTSDPAVVAGESHLFVPSDDVVMAEESSRPASSPSDDVFMTGKTYSTSVPCDVIMTVESCSTSDDAVMAGELLGGGDELMIQGALTDRPPLTIQPDQISPATNGSPFLPVISEAHLHGLIRMPSETPEPVATYEEEIPNDEEEDTDLSKASWLGAVGDDEDTNGADECSPSKRSVMIRKKAAIKEEMQFLLVHGDALLLSGDDFDFAIERKGMGLLLVGSDVLE